MSDRDDTAYVQGFLDRGELLPPGEYRITGAIHATPKDGGARMTDEESPRAVTPGELQDDFMDTCRALADYWADPAHSPDRDWPDRVRGLLHSFLVIFDGCSAGLPAFDIVARPHPDDKAFHQAEGENWIEDGTVINEDAMLHEHLYEGAWTVHRGPHYRERT